MKIIILILISVYLDFGTSFGAEEEVWDIKFDPATKSLQPTYIAITMRMTEGDINVTRDLDKKVEKVIPETKFKLRDLIEIGEKGYLKIKMIDNTLIDLGAKTRFQFKDYNYKTQKERSSVYELFEGKIRTWFRIPAAPEDIKIKAGTVAMGIRGTEVMLNMFTPDGGGNKVEEPVTDILLLSGEVQVETNQGKPYPLTPGTVFESDRFGDILAGKDNFLKISGEELLSYQGKGIDKEYDVLPFLNVARRSSASSSSLSPSPSPPPSTSMASSLPEAAAPSSDHQRVNKKTWKEILEEKYGKREEIEKKYVAPKVRGSGRQKKAKKECLEYTYFYVKDRKVGLCNKYSVD